MYELCNYHIEVGDKVDEDVFNATSPLKVTVVRLDPAATLVTIHADQSGLIGLLRHLHQQGFLLLSVSRERTPSYCLEDENVCHENHLT